MRAESVQAEWRRKTLEYVAAINAFVERAQRDGSERAGKEPPDTGREHLVPEVLEALRSANRTGDFAGFRERWPPAYLPFIELLEENGQSIPVVCLLEDGSIVARIGAEHLPGRVVLIRGDSVEDVPGVEFFGRGPDRRHFAIAQADGVHVLDGWQGSELAICPWPTGLEDLPDGFASSPFDGPPTPTRLIPFPDGERVLLVSEAGIYVLSPGGARRLLPTKDALLEERPGRSPPMYEGLLEDSPEGAPSFSLSMAHGAVSRDGKLIAVGSQDSKHLVFNDGLELIGDVGHSSEYPHYALFSADGGTLALNSCHFYSGITIGAPTRLLPGLSTESYDDDERVPVLEDGARVYAGVSRDDEFVVGDAAGYVRAFSTTGETRWQHFVGSTVGDIDISQDGRTLVVSTYAGYVSIIRLDAGTRAAYQIGTGNHLELRRWIFWKNEARPLLW